MTPFGMRLKEPPLDAFRGAAAARHRKRKGSSFSLEVVDRTSPGNAAGMIGTGVFILAFCAFALVISRGGSDESAAAAALGSAIFMPIGCALILGGIHLKIKRITVSIGSDRLRYEKRGLVGRRSFDETLGAYLCVLPRSDLVSNRGEVEGMAFYARLVHGDDPAKSVSLLVHTTDELGMIVEQGGERRAFEALARKLDLPLASVGADLSVTLRYPDELDLNLVQGPAKGGEEPLGLMLPLSSRRYKVAMLTDGFVAERGHPVYAIPFIGCVAGAIAARLLIADEQGRVVLPIVLVFFALFMLAFTLTRARLALAEGAVEASYTVAGAVVMRHRIPLGKIEELDISIDPSTRKRALRIASDAATIMWAQGDPEEVQLWFRDEVLRAVRSKS